VQPPIPRPPDRHNRLQLHHEECGDFDAHIWPRAHTLQYLELDNRHLHPASPPSRVRNQTYSLGAWAGRKSLGCRSRRVFGSVVARRPTCRTHPPVYLTVKRRRILRDAVQWQGNVRFPGLGWVHGGGQGETCSNPLKSTGSPYRDTKSSIGAAPTKTRRPRSVNGRLTRRRAWPPDQLTKTLCQRHAVLAHNSE